MPHPFSPAALPPEAQAALRRRDLHRLIAEIAEPGDGPPGATDLPGELLHALADWPRALAAREARRVPPRVVARSGGRRAAVSALPRPRCA